VDTATYIGRLSDGRTAATSAVTVALGATGLDIAGAAEPQSWNYTKLEAAAPLRWHDNEALLRTGQYPGATLFIADPGFAAAILKRSPQLSPGAHRWRFAMPGLAITALLALGIGAIYLFGFNPAQQLAGLLPHRVRAAIGEQAAASLAGGHQTCTAPEGVKALNTLVAELSAATLSGKAFEVRVVRWDLVNAFAVPGEQIVVSGGLINEAQSADEVAGVLAHEMGHGIELHPEAGIIRSLGLSALIELLASGQSSTLTNAGSLLLQLRYSREAEHQADVHALEILKTANISPKPFSGFFSRLLKREGGATKSVAPGDLGIFSTHPPTPERAAMAAAAATYPGRPALSEADWQALKHICG